MKARLAEWGATALPGSPADFGKLPFLISSHVLRHSCGYTTMGGTPDRSNTISATGRLLRRFATRRSRWIGLRISGADPRLAPASGELPSRPRYSGRIRVGHHGD